MKFDRTSILAIAGFLIFVFSYDRFLKKKYPHLQEPPAATSPDIGAMETPPAPLNLQPRSAEPPRLTATNETTVTASSPMPAAPPPDKLIFESEDVLWQVDPSGGGFYRVELKHYHTTMQPEQASDDEAQAERVNLVSDRLWVQPLLSKEMLDTKPYEVQVSPTTATFTRQVDELKISHTYEFPLKGYHVGWQVRVHNLSTSTKPVSIYLSMADLMHPLPAKGTFFLPGMPISRPSMVAITDADEARFDTEKACSDNTETLLASSPLSMVQILGFDRYHFITALIGAPVSSPATASLQSGLRGTYSFYKQPRQLTGHCQFLIFAGQNFGALAPGATTTADLSLFFGPKDYRVTKSIHPQLKETIDLGWFAFLAHPLLYILHFFYDLTGNYGLAIIILTLLLKIVFFPLTRAAALSMNKTRIHQPELNAIRARHKGDMATQQRETMAFMAKHKINPMKGCLPILPQMPVFIALYRVLSTAVELRQAPFFGWLQDLSAPDPLIITPILLAACMFLQQKLMPQLGTDDLQRKIMMWMPVIFAVMMIGFPAGMVLYMLVNTIVSMAQQHYFNTMFKKTHGAQP